MERQKRDAHLTKVPRSIRLDISVGDTSMKRKKEKQLPVSLPGGVKIIKMQNKEYDNEQHGKSKSQNVEITWWRREW